MSDMIIPVERVLTYSRIRIEGPQYFISIAHGNGGEVKIYFDPADLADAERRIYEAFRIREIAPRLSDGFAALPGIMIWLIRPMNGDITAMKSLKYGSI